MEEAAGPGPSTIDDDGSDSRGKRRKGRTDKGRKSDAEIRHELELRRLEQQLAKEVRPQPRVCDG